MLAQESRTKGKVRTVVMAKPKLVRCLGADWWEARDRMFPENEYGRAYRYANYMHI